MIEAFVGLVGGGKSFNSLRRMLSYIALGGRCCTNIRPTLWCERTGDLCPFSPLRDYLRSIGWNYQPRQFVYISFDSMVDDAEWFKNVPAGFDRDHRTLLVVDEATDLFDNLDRDKVRADSGYRALFRFLRLSRHAHIDVLFICQDLDAINSRLRKLVAGIWRSTDMRNFRLCRLKMSFPFDLFMLQKFDRNFKFELDRQWVKKDPRIYGLYESESFGGAIGVKWDGVAVANGKVKEIVKGFKMIWKVVICCLLAVNAFVVWCLVSSGVMEKKADRETVREIIVITNLSATVSAPVVQPKPVYPNCVRGDWQFVQAGEKKWGFFDGCRLDVGAPCEWGVCVEIEKLFVKCVASDRSIVWLLPYEAERVADRRDNSLASVNARPKLSAVGTDSRE